MENQNCKSLTTIIDVDRAAVRIREQPDLNTKKNDDQIESNEENLSNGDLVANGSAPIVPNGNSRLSAGSDRSRKDVSLIDIDSRIPSGSSNHDPKRDTIVTVDTDIVEGESRVRDCCPSFCYCESVCCTSYKDSFIRKAWHGLRQRVLNFVEHKYFELFILIMIGVSSLTLVSHVVPVLIPNPPSHFINHPRLFPDRMRSGRGGLGGGGGLEEPEHPTCFALSHTDLLNFLIQSVLTFSLLPQI